MALEPLSQRRKSSLAKACQAYQDQLDEPALQYLDTRGLRDSAGMHRFGVVRVPEPGHDQQVGRLAIPYLSPTGDAYDIRFRCMESHDCKAEGHGKYMGDPGVKVRLYNTRALVADTDYIFVAEGELDAATLGTCGWPAVGVAGVNAWGTWDHRARLFDGFRDVIVAADGDEAGAGLGRAVVRSVPRARVVRMPGDVNSVFVAGGREALARLFKEALS